MAFMPGVEPPEVWYKRWVSALSSTNCMALSSETCTAILLCDFEAEKERVVKEELWQTKSVSY